MSFLGVEEWDALDVVDNGDGTITLKKGYANETQSKKEEPSSKICEEV